MTEASERSKSSGRAGRLALAFGLLLPGVCCCLATWVGPTIGTFRLSLMEGLIPRYVGFENYASLFSETAFGGSLGSALKIAGWRVIAVAILPPLLGLSVGRLSQKLRRLARLLLAIPLALFAPALGIMAYAISFRGIDSLRGLWARPGFIHVPFAVYDLLATTALSAALVGLFYLAAARSPDGDRRMLTPVTGVIWGTSVLAVVAISLQSFIGPYFVGAPRQSLFPPLLFIFQSTLMQVRPGLGAAAGVILLLLIMSIGLIAGLVALALPVRLDLIPADESSAEDSQAASSKAGAVIALLAAALVCALWALPLPASLITWFSAQGRGLPLNMSVPGAIINGIVPVLIGVLILQVPLAFLTAFAIGALQPLGPRSRWLLLLFAPWLFATTDLFMIPYIDLFRSLDLISTFGTTIPPLFINVPMLFILTLFFAARAEHWQQARDAGESGALWRTVLLPSLPLVGALALAASLVAGANGMWQFATSGIRPEQGSILVALFTAVGFVGDLRAISGLIFGLWISRAVLLFVLIALLSVRYLDRLTLSRAPSSVPAAAFATELPEDA